MDRFRSVRELSPDVAAQISSASYIRSLAHVVEELVSNAIDAAASSIDVRCNWHEQSVSVTDNGCGIRASDIDKIGTLRCTSKESSYTTKLGFRGIALYALCRVARVQIITKARGEEGMSSSEVVDGSRIGRVSYLRRRSVPGTKIVVTRFLSRFPVRRQFALQTRESRGLLEIRDRLLRLAMPFPQLSFTLRNSSDGSLLLKLSKDRHIEDALRPLFGELFTCIVPLSVSKGGVEIAGYVSMPGSANVSPHLRLVYVNRRLMDIEEIREWMDQIWAIGTRLSQGKAQSSVYKPAYVLNFSLAASLYTVSGDPQKSRAVLVDEGAFPLEVLKRGLWNAWKGAYPLTVQELLKKQMFRESKERTSEVGKDSHRREDSESERQMPTNAPENKKRRNDHCVRHRLASKRRSLATNSLPYTQHDIQMMLKSENRTEHEMYYCQTQEKPYPLDEDFTKRVSQKVVRDKSHPVVSGRYVATEDAIEGPGRVNPNEEDTDCPAEVDVISATYEPESLNSTRNPSLYLSGSIIDLPHLAEEWSAVSATECNNSNQEIVGDPAGCDQGNTVDQSGNWDNGPITTQDDRAPSTPIRLLKNPQPLTEDSRHASLDRPFIQSAPPFYRPIQRNVHRNPRISIRSYSTVDKPFPESPIRQEWSPSSIDEEAKETQNHTVLSNGTAGLSPHTLYSMQRRQRHPIRERRVLLPGTDINVWNAEWNLGMPPVHDLSRQTPSLPVFLDRKILENPQLIGSVVKKFILIRCGQQVLAVDQHAADERVKLEELEDFIEQELENGTFSVELEKPVTIQLSSNEVQVFLEYEETINRWGWRGAVTTEQKSLELSHQPYVLKKHFTATDLQVYLQALEATLGAVGLPPCVRELLKSRACRSAVVFGDDLTASEQDALLRRLKQTRSCFQCAHGRPTVIPLVHLPSPTENHST